MNVYELSTHPTGNHACVSSENPWFVWCPGILGGSEPRVGHATYRAAEAEALRLAEEKPGRVFAIGGIVASVACADPAVFFWGEVPSQAIPESMRKTATLIRGVVIDGADTRLYQLSEPLEGNDCVLVVAMEILGKPLTAIFPPTLNGVFEGGARHLLGTIRGVLDHAAALERAGYVIEPEPALH